MGIQRPDLSKEEVFGKYVIKYNTCSNCSKEAIFTNNEEFVLSKFCPYCGKYTYNHE